MFDPAILLRTTLADCPRRFPDNKRHLSASQRVDACDDAVAMNRPRPDHAPRQRRTREALQSAFMLLATSRRYHEIRIDDILQASGVGRSTFYEHFASKDVLLASSMEGVISLLAGMLSDEFDPRRVETLLDHFWGRRTLARSIFQGPSSRVIRNALVQRIEAHLGRHGGERLRIPQRLAAHALADSMLSPIVAWLSGESTCTSANLASALQDASRAALAGMSTTAIPTASRSR